MTMSCGEEQITSSLWEFIISFNLLLLGFEGVTCERNIDDCPNHKCQNGGVCVDGVNTYNCRCPPQWTGMYGVTNHCNGAWVSKQGQVVTEVGPLYKSVCATSLGIVLTAYVPLCSLKEMFSRTFIGQMFWTQYRAKCCRTAVPNLFGTREWKISGGSFFHEPEVGEGWFGDDSSVLHLLCT